MAIAIAAGGVVAMFEAAKIFLLISFVVMSIKAIYDILWYFADLYVGRRRRAREVAERCFDEGRDVDRGVYLPHTPLRVEDDRELSLTKAEEKAHGDGDHQVIGL
eukprot:gene805-25654_t